MHIYSSMGKHYYLIGIGGVSMSALAKLLISRGHSVSGSDINPSTHVAGAVVYIGHNAQNIDNADVVFNRNYCLKNAKKSVSKNYEIYSKFSKNTQKLIKNTQKNAKKTQKTDIFSHSEVYGNNYTNISLTNKTGIDVVVISGAIKTDNVELIRARQLGIPIITRGELLARIATEYKTVIAVSGMHGKTTTTAMLAEVLIEAGKNPTVHLGGESRCFNSNLLIGNSDIFVTEACEYQDNFLHLKPDISVILNIEAEHLDYFKSLECIQKSFDTFANNSKTVVSHTNCKINHAVTFGSGGNYLAKNIKKTAHGYTFDCYKNANLLANFNLNTIGRMNIENALAVIAVCDCLHIKLIHIQRALANFHGTQRRFDIVQQCPLVIRDYAHHPTELRASINAVTEFYGNNFTIVFQPHTYSRTLAFFDDFVNVLRCCPRVALVATYPAREKIIDGASAYDLFLALKNYTSVQYFSSVHDAHIFIRSTTANLLVLGAGNL